MVENPDAKGVTSPSEWEMAWGKQSFQTLSRPVRAPVPSDLKVRSEDRGTFWAPKENPRNTSLRQASQNVDISWIILLTQTLPCLGLKVFDGLDDLEAGGNIGASPWRNHPDALASSRGRGTPNDHPKRQACFHRETLSIVPTCGLQDRPSHLLDWIYWSSLGNSWVNYGYNVYLYLVHG